MRSQIRRKNNEILKTAISNGDTNIIKCLRENWEFSIDDFQSGEWNELFKRFRTPRGLDRYNINLRILSELAGHWRFDITTVYNLLEMIKTSARSLTGEEKTRFTKNLDIFLSRYPVQPESHHNYAMIYQQFCEHLNQNPDANQVLNHILKKYGISDYDWTPNDRSAACRLLYEEYLNWVRKFDPVIENCHEIEDIVDDRPLASMSAKSIVKIPDRNGKFTVMVNKT